MFVVDVYFIYLFSVCFFSHSSNCILNRPMLDFKSNKCCNSNFKINISESEYYEEIKSSNFFVPMKTKKNRKVTEKKKVSYQLSSSNIQMENTKIIKIHSNSIQNNLQLFFEILST